LAYGSETDLLSVADTDMSSSDGSDDGGLDDAEEDQLVVLGYDLTKFPRKQQFVTCACGVFCFSLLYGYLQELISVKLCNRQLGLFQATTQFGGYTAWSFGLRNFSKQPKSPLYQKDNKNSIESKVPFRYYLGLSLLRALDLACTNLAMQFVNYPAKTLMKSSRVVFTMLFGVLFQKRHYRVADYTVVFFMVSGLAIFMHADANSSACFSPLGILLLVVSLLCDGAVTNMSESIMCRYNISQDEYIFSLYRLALVAISIAAFLKGDLIEGLNFLGTPGSYQSDGTDDAEWPKSTKILIMVLFSTTGFLGSSCSAAITKHFGALTMSLTSTARKATTVFISFAFFNNICTFEHIFGVVLFIISLVVKSFRAANKHAHHQKKRTSPVPKTHSLDLVANKQSSRDYLASSQNFTRRTLSATTSDIV